MPPKKWTSEPSDIGHKGRLRVDFVQKSAPAGAGQANLGSTKLRKLTIGRLPGHIFVENRPLNPIVLGSDARKNFSNPILPYTIQECQKIMSEQHLTGCVNQNLSFVSRGNFIFSRQHFPQNCLRPQILTFDPHILGYLLIFDP